MLTWETLCAVECEPLEVAMLWIVFAIVRSIEMGSSTLVARPAASSAGRRFIHRVFSTLSSPVAHRSCISFSKSPGFLLPNSIRSVNFRTRSNSSMANASIRRLFSSTYGWS